MFTAINDFFRGILWALVEMLMFVIDSIWEIVLRIGTLNFMKVENVGSWYMVIILFLVLFLIFRIFKITIKMFFDDEYREKVNIAKILMMLLGASIVASATPIVYSQLCNLTTDAIENVSSFVPMSGELKISSLLKESGRINLYDSSVVGESIETDAFEINAKDENDNYIYFPDLGNILLMIGVSLACTFIFIMVSLQIAQRLFLMFIKYLIAPYPMSSLIDPEDNSFGIWCKSLAGDMLMNFMQIYAVYVILFFCNNVELMAMLGNDAYAIFAKIVLFLGGLLALQELPTVIASFTGGRGAGVMQSLQDLKAMKSAATGMVGGAIAGAGAVLSGAGSMASGTIAGAGSVMRAGSEVSSMLGSAYQSATNSGAGSLKAGAKAIGSVAGAGVSAGLGAMGGKVASIYNGGSSSSGSTNGNTPSGSSSGTEGSSGSLSSGGSGSSNPNFDLPPTDSQLSSAEKFGIDNPSQYSRGELSMKLQESGAEESIWNNTQKGVSFLNGEPISESKNARNFTTEKATAIPKANFMYESNLNKNKK